MKNLLLTLALILTLNTSCSKDDLTDETTPIELGISGDWKPVAMNFNGEERTVSGELATQYFTQFKRFSYTPNKGYLNAWWTFGITIEWSYSNNIISTDYNNEMYFKYDKEIDELTGYNVGTTQLSPVPFIRYRRIN